jgi:hypothetical protein
MARGEQGTVVLWVLGLCLVVFLLGGFSFDMWRVLEARRELSAMADGAATAGANGLDSTALRRGHVLVDPGRARLLAVDSLRRHRDAAAVDGVEVVVRDGGVEVTLREGVTLALLGSFVGEPLTVRASARAVPRRVP